MSKHRLLTTEKTEKKYLKSFKKELPGKGAALF